MLQNSFVGLRNCRAPTFPLVGKYYLKTCPRNLGIHGKITNWPQRRSMAGGHFAARDPKYNFAPPHISRPHKIAADCLMTIMWLWIFWRTKHDGEVTFFGKHPWEVHVDEDDHEYHYTTAPKLEDS